MSFDEWQRDVDECMQKDFAITLGDTGLDRADLCRYFRENVDRADFVRWFAEKHDLTSVTDWLSFR